MSVTRASDLVGKSPGGRKLIAVVYADMVGYSRLIGLDDAGTLERLRTLRGSLIDPAIEEHGGSIVQTGGDSLLIVFDSIDGAMRCAMKVQQQVPAYDGDHPPDRTIRFRIGINIGDVIADGTDIHGDGVNVAVRLQAECPPGGICVSRAVNDHLHDRLNLAFEELGALKLKNISRPVEAFVLRLDSAATAPKPVEQDLVRNTPDVLPMPDKPSIAVLPFANMSGDPEQEYFADGMVEEIITALSRIRWLFVIARNSSFTYKGHAIDVKLVGRELDVRYVLEGSVRKSGQRVRITAQLIDALTGTNLWADRFDGSLEDVFDLQDEVAISVAGVIEPTLIASEIRRTAERPTNDLTAYDLYLRALPLWDSYERDPLMRARDLLGRAIERDSRYGPALALAAQCHFQLDMHGWADDRETNRRTGIDLARRALRGSPDDPEVLARAAFALGYFGEDVDTAIALVDRSLVLNPSCAMAWYWSGVLRNFVGRPDVALEHFATFLRLSPRDRFPGYLIGIGIALFFTRRYGEASATLRELLERLPNFAMNYRFLAACYAHMGRLDEARDIVRQLRTITPVVIPSVMPHRHPEYRELFLSGLRLAADEAA
jgi:TolB-like protein/class 3 adenylate cyclase